MLLWLLLPDGTGETGYINGELINHIPGREVGGATELNFSIGSSNCVGEFIDAVTDEVAISDRGLSEDEVEQNSNAEGFAAVESADKLALTWGEIKVSK